MKQKAALSPVMAFACGLKPSEKGLLRGPVLGLGGLGA